MYSVAAAPLTVRHHFAIRAVPLEAGAAVETREILPVIAEALVGVVQETVGRFSSANDLGWLGSKKRRKDR